ncbi:MAG: hypothetical protein Q4B09_10685 [Lachnospiraceae bacterium]|nr:hypothetical protein [Lachnospiraceae bacterium]
MDRFKPEFLKFADRTIQLLREAVTGDVLSLPFLDRNVIWIAHNDAVYVDKENVASYLKDIVKRLGKTFDLDVSFVKEITADCLSVTGRLSFGAGHHAFEETDVCFHVIWTRDAEDWMVKQVVTSDEKRFFRNENKGENSAFDLGSLYDRLPAGIIGCMDNQLLTVQMLNPIMLTVLEYESLEELKEYTGTSLYSLIHPDDLQKMRDFVEAVKSAGSREILTVRIRKKISLMPGCSLPVICFRRICSFFSGWIIPSSTDLTRGCTHRVRLHSEENVTIGRSWKISPVVFTDAICSSL